MPPETAQKQINALNKVVNNVIEQLRNAKEEWENEATVREAAAKTCIPTDTYNLISAIGIGKNLKPMPTSAPIQAGINYKDLCLSCF